MWVQKLTICSIKMSKTSSIFNLMPKMLRLTHFSGVKFEKNGNAKVKHLTNPKSANATDRLHRGDDYIYQRTKNQCWKWWFCPKWGLCLWCVRCLNWQQNRKEKESQHNGIGQAKNEIGQEPIFMGVGQEPVISGGIGVAKRSLDILPKIKKGFPDYGGKSIPKSMNGCHNRCEVFKEVQKACRNKWVFQPRKKKKTNKGSKVKGEVDQRVCSNCKN